MARLSRVFCQISLTTSHNAATAGSRFFRGAGLRRLPDVDRPICKKADTRILAYCLMPNHVHFIMIPSQTDGLRAALGEAHRRYTRFINSREGWTGHLWQERFHSFPMDETHALRAIRYVELNPVRAGLVSDPGAWPWSSAPAHLGHTSNPVVDTSSAHELVGDWPAYLAEALSDRDIAEVEKHSRTGRVLGSEMFLNRTERALGRSLRKQRPGPKPGAQRGSN